MARFYELNPDLPRITRADVIDDAFVAEALQELAPGDLKAR
jgi:hypothetical protein